MSNRTLWPCPNAVTKYFLHRKYRTEAAKMRQIWGWGDSKQMGHLMQEHYSLINIPLLYQHTTSVFLGLASKIKVLRISILQVCARTNVHCAIIENQIVSRLNLSAFTSSESKTSKSNISKISNIVKSAFECLLFSPLYHSPHQIRDF